jgi:hypothetical protein
MVKLRIAESLEGKPIVLVPSGGSGVGLNKLDVNRLIETAAVQAEAAPDQPKETNAEK